MDCFENIKFNFLSGMPVKSIDFEILLKNINWDSQKSFIDETILNERNTKYPLRKDYQIAFIKHIIQLFEDNQVPEIHDKLYELLASKIKEIDTEFSYKHFKVHDKWISIKESNSFIRDGTTGLKLWPAATILSNYIIQNSKDFAGHSILELGSGSSGLVGLTLLKSSNCKQIFLSDCHDTVVNNLIDNINRNLEDEESEKMEASLLMRQHLRLQNSCEFGILNLPWEDIVHNQSELLQKCHLSTILAADIVYDSSIFKVLVECLNILFTIYCASSLQFILSQTIRNYETFDNFCRLLRDNSFDIVELSLENLEYKIPVSNEPLNAVRIFKITKI